MPKIETIAPPFAHDPEVIAAIEALEQFREIAVQFYGEASQILERGITDRDSLFAFSKSIMQASEVVTCTARVQKGLLRAQDLTAMARRKQEEWELGRELHLEAKVYLLPGESSSRRVF